MVDAHSEAVLVYRRGGIRDEVVQIRDRSTGSVGARDIVQDVLRYRIETVGRHDVTLEGRADEITGLTRVRTRTSWIIDRDHLSIGRSRLREVPGPLQVRRHGSRRGN